MYGSEIMLWKEKERSRVRAVQMNHRGLLGIRRLDRVLNVQIREFCSEDGGEGEELDDKESQEEEIGEVVEREEVNSGEEEKEGEEKNVTEVESREESGEEEEEGEQKKDPVARERIIKIGGKYQLKSKQDKKD